MHRCGPGDARALRPRHHGRPHRRDLAPGAPTKSERAFGAVPARCRAALYRSRASRGRSDFGADFVHGETGSASAALGRPLWRGRPRGLKAAASRTTGAAKSLDLTKAKLAFLLHTVQRGLGKSLGNFIRWLDKGARCATPTCCTCLPPWQIGPASEFARPECRGAALACA